MLAVVFDCHIWNHKRNGGALSSGINRRGDLCLRVLGDAINVANTYNATLISAGDLVDSAGPIQPQLASAIQLVLNRCRAGCELLLGNHDMTAEGDHSLGLYEKLKIQIVDYSQVSIDFSIRTLLGSSQQYVLVPFHEPIDNPELYTSAAPLLIAHFGVYDEAFPPWLRHSSGAVDVEQLFRFMEERQLQCVLLGDWHTRNIWQKHNGVVIHHSSDPRCINSIRTSPQDLVIIQGGALIPTGHDNPGLHGYGTVALWDGNTVYWHELPGPRFCTVKTQEEQEAVLSEADTAGHRIFMRRFYKDEKPTRPSNSCLESYETLPAALESIAQQLEAALVVKNEEQQFARFMEEWVAQLSPEVAEAVKQVMKAYL